MTITIRLAHRILCRAFILDAKHAADIIRNVARRAGVSTMALDWSVAR